MIIDSRLRRAFDDDPAFQFRDRARLLDGNLVADLVFLRLVMGMIILRAPHRLLEKRMREAPLDLHDHGLFLLVADDDALENSFRHLHQPFFAVARFCEAIVLARAMSRRTSRTRDVFSSWPVARWKRRLNCSFFMRRTSSFN